MRLTRIDRLVRGAAVAAATLGLALAAAAQEADPGEAPAEPTGPDELDMALDLRAEGNRKSAVSQRAVDQLSDKRDELYGEYKQVNRQIDELRVYNRKMEELIDQQVEEMGSLREQIDRASLVGRQVTPLMLKMIESLDRFIRLDVPFNLSERTERVARLRELMDDVNVSDAERYRLILEAYQIENEFGRTIEAYQGTVESNGSSKTVDFLRFGRVVLVYQTLDGSEAGFWDQRARQWVPLDDEFRNPVREGLRIARKQKPPDLIKLPVPAPEVL